MTRNTRGYRCMGVLARPLASFISLSRLVDSSSSKTNTSILSTSNRNSRCNRLLSLSITSNSHRLNNKLNNSLSSSSPSISSSRLNS